MDDFSSGQCSNQLAGSGAQTDDSVLLASSCPKKRAGRKKFRETRHPVYRGVRQRNGNRWVCEVRTPTNNSRIWLGSYPTAEMAARAHDVAALALRGRVACLNFADSAWRLPVPVSTDTMDIQRAAAEAAELFRPPELDEVPTQEGNVVGAHHHHDAVLADGGGDAPPIMNNNNYDFAPETSSSGLYMDEEAMFNMPSLMDNMAEGLMLPPPPSNTCVWDDNENECDDFSLWNY
ncbi:hypothetical protein RND81_06G238000 [Saponaria officinalis]|uniref:AP2/ERF domain-containing protein n=1 Tax=Saponaria officinalis TaxID=3572 RepID=A0AAW1KFW5_SAPOF